MSYYCLNYIHSDLPDLVNLNQIPILSPEIIANLNYNR